MNDWFVGDWICWNEPELVTTGGVTFHTISYRHIHIASTTPVGASIGFKREFKYTDRFHSGGNYCANHSFYHWSAILVSNANAGVEVRFDSVGRTELINNCPPTTPVNGPKSHSEIYLPEGTGATSMREHSKQRTFVRLKL